MGACQSYSRILVRQLAVALGSLSLFLGQSAVAQTSDSYLNVDEYGAMSSPAAITSIFLRGASVRPTGV